MLPSTHPWKLAKFATGLLLVCPGYPAVACLMLSKETPPGVDHVCIAGKRSCVGEWTDWSPCNVTCGDGVKHSTFNIIVPAMLGGSCPQIADGGIRFEPCVGPNTTAGAIGPNCEECLPGFGGPLCEQCAAGTWSAGGPANVTTCTACVNGYTTAPGATAEAACSESTGTQITFCILSCAVTKSVARIISDCGTPDSNDIYAVITASDCALWKYSAPVVDPTCNSFATLQCAMEATWQLGMAPAHLVMLDNTPWVAKTPSAMTVTREPSQR